ncbi:TetR/AcrR family transcriptional regulator C-terminal ligand-binding domain-containing protein [Streptomyces caniscabiei]|uniref:TetR/AcrR family transcriptional regulator C-terminal ligand-binding domain-containing protein n=1 Tax=Streptomyces caniscabiei TaxID=2746961 RepID=UPI000765F700|nr:TetR/AcrR family transcriptional regulator C-terminal ligand-binding domain-containing protein [Streptomyces caniscabiei]
MVGETVLCLIQIVEEQLAADPDIQVVVCESATPDFFCTGAGSPRGARRGALDHAGLTDDLVAVTIGPGRLREELVATMTRALWSPDASRVDLLSALHDTARQEPELCGLVRQRYVDSLYQAVEGVPAHAVERGDPPPRQADPSGGHSVAVSAALALLLHWWLVRDRQVGDDGIAAIVDAVLMPLL